MVVLAAVLRTGGIAVAHQLFHLVALQPLQPTLQINGEALAFVVVSQGPGGVGGDAAETIHQAAQARSAEHQIAIRFAGVEPHQVAHGIGSEGGAAKAVEAAQALGPCLAGELHRQVGRQGEHLERPLGVHPHQQQGIGIGRSAGGGLVDRIAWLLAVETDHQQSDAAARRLAQVGRAELPHRFGGAIGLGPDQAEQPQARGDSGGSRPQPQQGGPQAGLGLGGTTGHRGSAATHFGLTR